MGGGAQRKRGREVREFEERNLTFPVARKCTIFCDKFAPVVVIRKAVGFDTFVALRRLSLWPSPHQLDLRRRGDQCIGPLHSVHSRVANCKRPELTNALSS
jgi:hypothetical protein